MSQRSLFSRFFGGGVHYSLGGLISAAIQLGLVLVYSAVIEPRLFGILALLLIAQVFAEVIFNLGVNGSIVTLYFAAKTDRERGRIINTANLFSLGFGFCFFALVFVLREPLGSWLVGDEGSVGFWFGLALLGGFLQNTIAVPQCVLRVLEKSRAYAVCEVALVALKAGFILYFLLVLNWGIEAVLWGHVVGAGTMALVMGLPLLRFVRVGFDLGVLRELVRLGSPMVVAWLLTWILTSIDRIFIKTYLSLEQVGLYAFALRIAGVLRIFLATPVHHIWPTIIFSTEGSSEEKNYSRLFSFYLLVAAVFYGMVVLFSEELFYFLPAKYSGSQSFLPALALLPVLTGAGFILSSGARLARRNEVFPMATAGGLAFAIIGNYFAVQYWGAVGVAVTTVFATVLINLIVYVFSQKVRALDLGRINLWALLFGSLGLCFLGIVPTLALEWRIGLLAMMVGLVVLRFRAFRAS